MKSNRLTGPAPGEGTPRTTSPPYRPGWPKILTGKLIGLPAALALTLLASPALAQFLPDHDGVRLLRMDYRNASGERGVSLYHYDRTGRLGRSTWMLEDHSRHSNNYYLYDEDGRQIEKYREFSDGLTSTQRYEYDARGRCTLERFARSDGVEGQAAFSWDEDGHLRKAECERFRGWLTATLLYSYDGDRLAAATIASGADSVGSITYRYDAAGFLIEEHWDFGGRWSQTFGYVYENRPGVLYAPASPLQAFDTRFRTREEDYDYDGQIGGPSTYTYDALGRLAEKVFERSDGVRTSTTYTYDDRGNLISSRRTHPDGRTTDFLYHFDPAGRLIARTTGGEGGPESSEAYQYDRLGRLERAIYRNMDSWLTGEITFEYDAWDRLSGGRFAAAEGPGATLEVGTDLWGNVTRVVWTFADGRTQTYEYGYERIDLAVPLADPGTDDRLARELRQQATPLPPGDPLAWTDEDLAWLDALAGPRILAFGEATHGTREFLHARRRILQYLAEHHGYRTVAAEAHFSECLYLDDCLRREECDLESAMRERMMIWTTRTQEMLAFLEWMRAYNHDRPPEEHLHYVGIDSQVSRQIQGLLHTLLAGSKADPPDAAQPDALIEQVDAVLAPIAALRRADYEAMTDEERARIDHRLSELRAELLSADLEARLGEYTAACAVHLVEAARQSLEFLQQYFHHQRVVRDRHMAENLRWVLRDSDQRIVLWAHNAHIAADHGYARDAGGGMGWQLREAFGDDYRAIALAFTRGEFLAKVLEANGEDSPEPRTIVFVVDPPDGAVNRCLEARSPAGAEPGAYFLNLRDLAADASLRRWLDVPRPLLGVGDLFLGAEGIDAYHYGGDRILTLPRAFDGLLYLRDTHATTMLPKAASED